MVKTISQFIINSGYKMMADLTVHLGNIFLVIFISRLLDVVAAGRFSVANTYYGIGLIISYWGFNPLITREVAKKPSIFGRYFSNALILRVIFSTVMAILLIGIAYGLYDDPVLRQSLTILALSIPAGSINQLILAAFISFEKIKYLSIVSIILSLAKITFGYILLNSGKDLTSIILLLTGIEYLTLFCYSILLRKYLPKFNFQFDQNFSLSIIKISFPLFSMALVTILDARTEIIIISLFLGEEAVGFYSVVSTVLGFFFLLPESIRLTALPLFTRYSETENFKRLLVVSSQLVIIFFLPVSIILFFFAGDIIPFIFTSKFAYSITLMQIIVWSLVSFSLTMIASRALIVLNHEKKVARATLASAIITNVANIVAAPLVGLHGVAFVRMGTSVLLLILCLRYLDILGFRMIKRSFLWRISLVCITMMIGMGSLIHIQKWLALLTGILMYTGGLFLLKIWTRNDLAQAGRVFLSLFDRKQKADSEMINGD